jgi:hypothetical protein
MRRSLTILLTSIVTMFAMASAAQAVVVSMGASGQAGVSLVPSQRTNPPVSGTCSDPWLSSDLSLPSNGLCSHGGPVMHANETFALTWDPLRRYWQTTRNYVEQFLSDVASGSHTLTSPYAVTPQYNDGGGRAANDSVYGGGCIDFGSVGGSACKFGSTNGTGPGHDYGASGCPVSGTNQFAPTASGGFASGPNDTCVTDAQIQSELTAMIGQSALAQGAQSGHTPMVVVMLPPGVESCLDAAGTLCSANAGSTGQFCSYHSQVNVGGGIGQIAYVVAPWTALTECDEPGVPALPSTPTAQELAINMGSRLVSPVSQGQIAAIVNPGLNGWYGLGGSEINDNGCVPLPTTLDKVTVGTSSQNPYYVQREFNNAGVIETDPNAPRCAPFVALTPTFVVPVSANPGDVVQFDGSTTVSTLIVPRAHYLWSFGDGTSAVGPSVVHTYSAAGSYTVGLTVTDRGGNVANISRTITVGGTGTPVTPPTTHPGNTRWSLHLQLMPQSLRSMLAGGLATRVTSSKVASGIVTLTISRASARKAHIKAGRGSSVVIARGTVSGINAGRNTLHLRISRAVAAKLKRLRHVSLTVRMALVARDGTHLAIVAAGRY